MLVYFSSCNLHTKAEAMDLKDIPQRSYQPPPHPHPHTIRRFTFPYESLQFSLTAQSDQGAINLRVGLLVGRQEWLGWRLLYRQLTHNSPDQPSFLAPLTLHFINDNEQRTNLTLQACCQEPTRVPRLIRQSQKWKLKEKSASAGWGHLSAVDTLWLWQEPHYYHHMVLGRIQRHKAK